MPWGFFTAMARHCLSAFLFLCLTGAAFAGEGRSSGLISAGSRWETRYQVIESGEPGPTVVVTGGVHGDEPAGARAAEQICHWPVLKGRLVVIPGANGAGLAAGTRFIPGVNPEERDLNRDFPKTGAEDKAAGEPAAALWGFVVSQKPDWLIDLHEGYGFHRLQAGSVGSSIIDSNGAEADAAVPAMLAAVNASIPEADRQFVNLSRPVDGSLARAAAERLGAAAMILETTSHDQALSLRTRQHRTMVGSLLVKLGMMAPARTAEMVTPAASHSLRVAVFDDAGVGEGGPENVEAALRGIPDSLAWRVGTEDIREGVLSQFDLVVFPGGSGSAQGNKLGETAAPRSADLSARAAAMSASAPVPTWQPPTIRGRSASAITSLSLKCVRCRGKARKACGFADLPRW